MNSTKSQILILTNTNETVPRDSKSPIEKIYMYPLYLAKPYLRMATSIRKGFEEILNTFFDQG